MINFIRILGRDLRGHGLLAYFFFLSIVKKAIILNSKIIYFKIKKLQVGF